MKKITLLIAITCVAALWHSASAQTLNWSSIQTDQKHLANVNIGWDYSASAGLGYAYILKTKIPAAINAQFSVPAGENLTDDLKAKAGIQALVFRKGKFMTTVKVNGIYRQYHSKMVSLKNFGGEFTAVAGYYRMKWFVSGEFGFDKAIVTHVRNSDLNKEYYPSIRDGWYVPTGGNFRYGIQAGYSLRSFDIYSKVGKTTDQYFESTAMVPFYFEFGVNKRF